MSYLRCQLPEALAVYTEATKLAKDQREIEHVVLYEKGENEAANVCGMFMHVVTLAHLYPTTCEWCL